MAKSFLNNSNVPLGLRNNNPGNLVTGINWQGLIGSNGRFCVFENCAWGIRAMAIDLKGDIENDGLNTITKLIYQYAPPSENNTAAYIATVVAYTGISANTQLSGDRNTLKRLIRSFMNVELGTNYSALLSDADIFEGIDLMNGDVPTGAYVGLGISGLVLIGAIALLVTTRNP